MIHSCPLAPAAYPEITVHISDSGARLVGRRGLTNIMGLPILFCPWCGRHLGERAEVQRRAFGEPYRETDEVPL